MSLGHMTSWITLLTTLLSACGGGVVVKRAQIPAELLEEVDPGAGGGSVEIERPIITSPGEGDKKVGSQSVTISGTCLPERFVNMLVSPDTTLNASTTCSAGGTFSFTKTFSDGEHEIRVTQQATQLTPDPSASEAAILNLTVDSTGPAAIAITSPDNLTHYTNATSLNIQGTCETGATVSISGAATTSTTCANGTFSAAVALGVENTYAYAVTQKDDLDRSSAAENLSVIVDRTAPDDFTFVTAATFIAPSNTPTISWNGSNDTSTFSYSFAHDLDDDCASPLATINAITATSYTPTTGWADGMYYVCVTATDAAGNTKAATGTDIIVYVDTAAPSAFAIDALADNPTNDTTPTFTWTASSDTTAFTYDVGVFSDSACSTQVQVSTGITSSATRSFTPTALATGTYYFCASATDSSAPTARTTAATNSPYSFVVDATNPAAFDFTIGPNVNTNDSTPTISWSAATDTTTVVYDLAYATSADCSSPIATITNLSTTTYTPSAMWSDGLYSICVTARDVVGNSTAATSNPLSLRVDTTPPATFAINTITNNVTNDATPTITWTAATDDSTFTYSIQVDNDASCPSPIQQQASIASADPREFTFNALATGTYYICAQAVDQHGQTRNASNNSYQFVVDLEAPADFSIASAMSPTATANSQPTLDWADSSDNHSAVTYDAIIDNDSDCSSPTQSVNGLTSSAWTPSTALAEGTYYLCVTARDLAGNTKAGTGPFEFKVDLNPPSAFQINTYTNNRNNDLTPTITWTAATDTMTSVTYTVAIATTSNCATPHQTQSGITGTSFEVTSALTDQTTYYICVTAKDGVEHTRTATDGASNNYYQFMADAAVVNFAVTSPTNASTTGGWPLQIYGTCEPITGSTTEVTLSGDVQDGGDVSVNCTSGGTWSYQWDHGGAATTYTNITASQVDAAGNVATPIVRTWTFNPSLVPEPVITSPASPHLQKEMTVNIVVSTGSNCMGATNHELHLYRGVDPSLTQIDAAPCDNTASYNFQVIENADGFYNYAVRRHDHDNTTESQAVPLQVRIDSTSPGSFNIDTLTGNVTNDTTPTFTWSAAADDTAVDYRVELHSANTCDALIAGETATALTNRTHTFTGPLAEGTYYVCVWADDELNNGETAASNNGYAFTVDLTAPSTFAINAVTTPTNDATPTVSWEAATDSYSVTYDVRIDNTSNCAVPEAQSLGQAGTSFTPASDLADGTYYVCVVASDVAGNARTASNSSTLSFRIDTTQPSTFSINMITNNATNDTTPTFTWTSATDPSNVSYSATIGNNVDCSSAVESSGAQAGTSFTPSSALAEGTYYVCVSAVDDLNNGPRLATNNGYSFVVDTANPGDFDVVALTNDLTNDDTPTLSWSAASAGSGTAVTYALRLDNNSTSCASPEYSADNISGTSHTVASALANTTYYMCLTAIDAAGNSTNATTYPYDFTMDAEAPTDLNVTGPADVVGTLTPSATWDDANGEDLYRVYVNTGANNCAAGNHATYLTLAPETVSQALSFTLDGTYYVCVVAEDLAGNQMTDHKSFIVDTTAPGSFSIDALTNNRTNSATPTLTWTEPSDITSLTYDVIIDDNNDCATPVASATGLTSRTYTSSVALDDVTYYFCVTARDAIGNTTNASNQFYAFTVDTVDPTGLEVTGPAANVTDTTPDVTWDDATGEDYYDVYVNTSTDPVDCTNGAAFEQENIAADTTSITISSALADGSYDVCVRARDLAGNEITDSKSFVVDTTAPGNFSITAFASNKTSNLLPTINWGAASDVSAVTYNVKVMSDNDCSGTVHEEFTDVSGTSATLTDALSTDTDYWICIVATDAVNLTKAASNNPYQFRAEALNVPVILVPATQQSVSNVTTHEISGTCNIGWNVILSGGKDDSVVCDAQGEFAFTHAGMTDRTYNYTVVQNNGGANTQPATASITIDTTPPDFPVIVLPASNPFSSAASTINISGTCENGATVDISLASPSWSDAKTCTNGEFAFTYTAAGVGSYTFTLDQTDVAGNASEDRQLVWNYDAGLSAAPTITTPAATPRFTTTGSLTISGGCVYTAAGTDVVLGGQVLESEAAGGSDETTGADADGLILVTCASTSGGTYSFTINKASQGTYALNVTQTEPAKSVSAPANLTWIYDAAVAVPTITLPTFPYTAAGDLTITGACEAGSTVHLTGDATVQTTCSAGPVPVGATNNGTYSLSVTGLADGTYYFDIHQVDRAGNTSTAVTGLRWDRDSNVATPVTVATVAAATVYTAESQIVLGGACTANYTVTLSGDVVAGDVTNPANSLTMTCSGAGAYSFTIAKSSDGTYAFNLVQQFGAGSPSPATTRTWVRDTIAPTIDTLTGPSDPNRVAVVEFAYTGSDANTFSFDCKIEKAGGGSVNFAPCGPTPRLYPNLLPDSNNEYTFSIRAVDLAGNVSPTSTWTFLHIGYKTLALYRMNSGSDFDVSTNLSTSGKEMSHTSTTSGTGKFAEGRVLDNTDDRLDVTTDSDYDLLTDAGGLGLVTIEFWHKLSACTPSGNWDKSILSWVDTSDTTNKVGFRLVLRKQGSNFNVELVHNHNVAGTSNSSVTIKGRSAVHKSECSGTLNWHHFAVVIDQNSSIDLYVDGTKLAGSTTNARVYIPEASTGRMRFLLTPAGAFDGDFATVDDLRISQVRRYTTGFTPPAASFSLD